MRRLAMLVCTLVLVACAGCGAKQEDIAFLHDSELLLGMEGRALLEDLDMYVHWEQEDGMDYTYASTDGRFEVLGVNFDRMEMALTDERVTRVGYITDSDDFAAEYERLRDSFVGAYGEHDLVMEASEGGNDVFYWNVTDHYTVALNGLPDGEGDDPEGGSQGKLIVTQFYYPNGRGS